jgi:cardiolipin synthase
VPTIRRIGRTQWIAQTQQKLLVTSMPSGNEDTTEPYRKKLADVKDNAYTIPNGLCILRIAMTPVIGTLVVYAHYPLACGLFAFAGFTDLLDGYIARHWPSQRSLLGSMLDPVADKLLVTSLFITLTYVHLIPVALTAVVILRDVCLVAGGFIRRYQLLDPPVTLKRYFDPSVSSVQITPTFFSKVCLGKHQKFHYKHLG